MKIQTSVLSPRPFLVSSLLVLCLGSGFVSGRASDQQEKTEKVVRTEGSAAQITKYTPIPEATESCTPEESEWWKRFLKAGTELQKRSDEGSKTKFFRLMLEGQQKGHRIPLKDRPAQSLSSGRTTYPESARRRGVQGTVVLSVEFRGDGSVDDIQISEGLGYGLDENAIQAARQIVFLPAVKDRAFVSSRGETKYGFYLGGSPPKSSAR